jgi:Zn-dependent protease
MINTLFSNPILFFISIAALLLAISIHECAHAWTADRLGDPTARLAGRISLNPLVHLDLFGLLFLLFFGFGWGKPVEFDVFNLKNPRKDAALISIAGPLSNIILALILSLILRLFTFYNHSFLSTIGGIILIRFILMNLVLGVFNLIPIHPLDGFKIVGGLLPEERSREWYGLERFGMLFLILLIIPIGGSSLLDGVLQPALRLLFPLFIPMTGTGVV